MAQRGHSLGGLQCSLLPMFYTDAQLPPRTAKLRWH